MPLSFIAAGLRHRHLILRLTASRLSARYRGTWLGWIWLIAMPLFLLGVYYFVFAEVFEARWGTSAASEDAPFALVLFCGLTLYGFFAECVNEAPTLLLSYENYLKQLRFPSEVLAWVSLLSAGVRVVASLAVLLLAYVLLVGAPPPTALLFPLALVPIALLSLGASWLLASLGVFLRDLSHGTSVVTTALLFLSPVFYPASRVPEAFASWYWLNPFTSILEAARSTLFAGQLPAWEPLALTTLLGGIAAWGGYAWFLRTKQSFVDVL